MKIVADANIPFVRECFSSVGDVEVVGGRDITPEVVVGADALVVRSITPVNEALLAAGRVRFVGTATIGFDHVDLSYLQRNGIGFASAPGSNANSAAEYVIAALLEVGRRHGIRLEGRSIGVIGVGNVGSRVAAKCEALGMRVLRNDPPLQRQTSDPKYVPIEALYECDFITMHTPLTYEGVDRTFHLAGEQFFSALKPGAVFVNAARGAVADSAALKRARDAGRLQAVVLDVWENEPDIDPEMLGRVEIATPHIAGYSLDGKIAGLIMIYKSLCRHFDVASKFDITDFLPAPGVPRLDMDATEAADEELAARAVRQVYDIVRDDGNLRRITTERAESRGRFFDALRKEYPVRREFQNTTVVLPARQGTLARKLQGIGFRVEGGGQDAAC